MKSVLNNRATSVLHFGIKFDPVVINIFKLLHLKVGKLPTLA